MKKILCILNSTKRDVDIFNLYNNIEGFNSFFLFNKKKFKTKNTDENYNLLKDRENNSL
jgi:hypothetical protein